MTGEFTILVVDDEEEIADLYATWLGADHETWTAYDGATALERVDESVDLVFLDRRMPELSGDEVLTEIRDRGLDCFVVLVTAVDADFDIIDLGFDEYLTKPVMRDDMAETIEKMQERRDYDETLQEYYALVSKKVALESEKTPAELRHSEEYQEMVDRVDELADEADRSVSDADDEFLFREFPDG